jgi:hypothetical protein
MDPLSVNTTILPGSTFDVNEFATQERKRLLDEQAQRRTRYNQLWEKAAEVSGGNPWNVNLIGERQKLLEEGAGLMSEGVDITDITNPKSAKQAAEYRNRFEKLNHDANMSKAMEDLATNARALLAKDARDRGGEGVYDAEASIKNISTLMQQKTVGEAQKFLAGLGDNLLVTKPKYVDVGQVIKKDLPNYVTTIKNEEAKKVGNQVVTNSWNEIDPKEIKNGFTQMLISNADLRRTVQKQKSEDPLSLPGESDVDFMMRTYGNQKTRQLIAKKSEPYKPPYKPDKPEPPAYEVSNSPVNTTISIKNGSYTSTGMNPITFSQKKTFMVSPGAGTISMASGKPHALKGAVEITPINTAEYYVSTKPNKQWPAGTILPAGADTRKNGGVKKRFVQATYQYGEGVKAETRTILIPYENIQNELDAQYQVSGEIDKANANTDPLGIL